MSDEKDSNAPQGQPDYGQSASYSQSPSYSMSTTASVGAAAADGPAVAYGTSAGAAAQSDGAIIDVTSASFMNDVIAASRSGPVVVDFWAPWCGPCKQLGPVIEKVVGEAAAEGRAITLAKMDVEKYPDISQQMGIQSIPAVVAFVDGRPADAFMGNKSEAEVRAFIDKVAGPTPEGATVQEMMGEADRLLKDRDYEQAAALYDHVLKIEGGNLDAYTGLGQCYLGVGELDVAEALIAKVPPEHHDQLPLSMLVKALELARQAGDLGDLETLAAAAANDPDNLDARFDYAIALNGQNRREDAAKELVAIVKADRTWRDDGARAQLVEFFDTWGNGDPATLAGRRALSSVLFS